jgi:hypothetical protein
LSYVSGKVAPIDDGEMTVVLKNCKFKRGFEELRAGDQQATKNYRRNARTSPVQMSWLTGADLQGYVFGYGQEGRAVLLAPGFDDGAG